MDLIENIINKEWVLFDAVNNIGGRADCQNDWETFYIMRYSAFSVWSVKTLGSYYTDLIDAELQGRNLIVEKYAYMMRDTVPEYYKEQLEPMLPAISKWKQEKICKIVELLLEDEKNLRRMHPILDEKGRSLLYSDEWASFQNYLSGELKTYSEETLKFYYEDTKKLLDQGESPALLIRNTMAKFYGYNGVEDLV